MMRTVACTDFHTEMQDNYIGFGIEHTFVFARSHIDSKSNFWTLERGCRLHWVMTRNV